jgi:hypothetical protein
MEILQMKPPAEKGKGPQDCRKTYICLVEPEVVLLRRVVRLFNPFRAFTVQVQLFFR